ncbi:MAG: PD40 domain-containing protein, partial [Bacteroidales bacterium]|nr:PD40 domain-containing protein [Bacteroidales bacterium]
MKKYLLTLIAITCSLTAQIKAQEETRLLRFPTIFNNQVVFTYGGDLYTVSADGGTARRLTSHNGYEMFAHFSPDGKTLAFTGQYDGNTEVFTIPASGGIPNRVTYTATLGRDDVGDRMGPNNIVMGWTPDGNSIVFRSRKQSFNSFKGNLFIVNYEGGLPEELPFSVAGFNSYSPEGNKLAFNRVFREFRTWKYYQGGMADDIRIFDFKTKETTKITDNPQQDIFPMWHQDKIYFLSDRDHIMNIFVYDLTSKITRKVTNFKDYDVKFPSAGPESIVFEKGGFLYKLSLSNEEVSKIPVFISNDLNIAREEIKDVSKSITSISLSPKAKRLLISARGDLFNIPAKNGISNNLTHSSNIHERDGDWSPDGKSMAYISDANGEFEIYIGGTEPGAEFKALTKNSKTYIFGFSWSPNSKKIAYHDKNYRLWVIDIQSGKQTKVAESPIGAIGDYSWSPDSKWISYVCPEPGMNRISLYNLENNRSEYLTDAWYNSGSPQFTKNGKYLVFSSAREFSPSYSMTEWNHIYQDMNNLFIITLAADTPNPMGPKDDQPELETSPGKKKKAEETKDADIKVDLDGIETRVIGLPLQAGNYYNIQTLDNKTFYLFSNSRSGGTSLRSFDLDKGKETKHGNNLNYLISNDGKKMLLMQGNKFSITDIPSGKASMSSVINLSDMKVMVNKHEEWSQIFDESWRQMRDFFYDPNHHGADWKAVYEKYQPLVKYVAHRSDLTYIIGEMVGELSVGHSYVNNGERPMPKRISTGLLGAQLEKDPSGYFMIKEILPGDNWDPSLRSPLRDIGLDVNQGDLILSVNGITTKGLSNPYSLLIGQAEKTVALELGIQGSTKDIKKILVKPISDESSLYYLKWVEDNIKKVNEATNGKVGYIHIPDMGVTGLNEFVKHYYPQLTKKALIIDDRGNGGGNVSPMIIERLKREITYATMHTNQKIGSVNPVGTMTGPKVALIDQYSASDGDLFPYRFKYNKIGKTIGKRTWGGVVGYSGSIPCIDGGSIITPSYAPYAADGSGFIIEGYGVDPDIIIDNEPYDEFIGKDKQLDKA